VCLLHSIRDTAVRRYIFAAISVLFFCGKLMAETPGELRLGRAGHAFDHLAGIGAQAEVAAASGANIIYSSGVGEAGYQGLPPEKEFATLRKNVSEYSHRAKELGIELNIGYLCATSIVKLDAFDKNWTAEFRAQFKTRPAEWRQQDRQGKPLASWYGGDYNPACMSNPDWRAYEHAMIRYQLEAGSDGIFFDNPTVHPQGCYCSHCMKAFAEYVVKNAAKPIGPVPADDTEALRKLADSQPELFLRFRSTIARDFVAEMRTYARTINPRALITCNNSLNSPSVFYSQCRMYGYNINEMSKTEDLVVVEDMGSQPRLEANGQTVEYGPMYKLLHAINHRKPVVAVTIAGADYHTAPNLMQLAMAEATANNSSYLSWPTWPEDQRKRMIAAVRPQANFLRRHQDLLNDAPFRADVALFLPFQRWTETDVCTASNLAAALTKANIQYKVFDETAFETGVLGTRWPVLLTESRALLNKSSLGWNTDIEKEGFKIVEASKPDWLSSLQKAIGRPSITVDGPSTVRATVHDQVPPGKVVPARTIIHLYNLNVQRMSSFEDKVTPATDVNVTVVAPFWNVKSVRLDSADQGTVTGALKFTEKEPEVGGAAVSFTIPRLEVSAIVVVEH
jgi:hypothetical protein